MRKMRFLAIGLKTGTEVLLFPAEELKAWTSDARIAEILENRFPTLRGHPCRIGRYGGFLEVVRKGTSLAHILEHLTLAILGEHSPSAMTVADNGFFRLYFPNLEKSRVERAFAEAASVILEILKEGSRA